MKKILAALLFLGVFSPLMGQEQLSVLIDYYPSTSESNEIWLKSKSDMLEAFEKNDLNPIFNDEDSLLPPTALKLQAHLSVDDDTIIINCELTSTQDDDFEQSIYSQGALRLGTRAKWGFISDEIIKAVNDYPRDLTLSLEDIIPEEIEVKIEPEPEPESEPEPELELAEVEAISDVVLIQELEENSSLIRFNSFSIAPSVAMPIGGYSEYIDYQAGVYLGFAFELAPLPLLYQFEIDLGVESPSNTHIDKMIFSTVQLNVAYPININDCSIMPGVSLGAQLHWVEGNLYNYSEIDNAFYSEFLISLSTEFSYRFHKESSLSQFGVFVKPEISFFPSQNDYGSTASISAGIKIFPKRGE